MAIHRSENRRGSSLPSMSSPGRAHCEAPLGSSSPPCCRSAPPGASRVASRLGDRVTNAMNLFAKL